MNEQGTPAPRAPDPTSREERRAARRSERSGRRGGVFGPVLLIVAVLLFLAANLGYLGSVSLFQLVQLWPVLLILGGIDLAIGRRFPLAAVVIDVLVLAGAVALAGAQPGAIPGLHQDLVNRSSLSVPRDASRTLELRVTGGAARYSIASGATALVEAVSDRVDLRLVEDRRSGDAAAVRIEQRSEPFSGFPGGRANVDVRVAGDVALTLRFDAGAGDFTVDLRDLKVREVRMATGAAAMRLILPTPDGEVPVRIDAGASSITVEVPDGVEARIATTGLASTRTSGSRFTSSGNDVATAGYAAARDRVTVTITAGASSVTVR